VKFLRKHHKTRAAPMAYVVASFDVMTYDKWRAHKRLVAYRERARKHKQLKH